MSSNNSSNNSSGVGLTDQEKKILCEFLNNLKKTDKVLEFGSGQSTKEISAFVKEIVSIEHQEDWFLKVSKDLPNNCTILLKKPNQ